MSIYAFILKGGIIIFLVNDRLWQVDLFGTKPYYLLVRKEEQSFDKLDEINWKKKLDWLKS